MPSEREPNPALTFEGEGIVGKWRPLMTKDGPICEITLLMSDPRPTDLDLLWSTIGVSCTVQIEFAGRQVRGTLGP